MNAEPPVRTPGPSTPLSLAVVASLSIALYAWTATFDYLAYDDIRLIEMHGEYLGDPANLVGAFREDTFSFLGPASGGLYYRPLLWVSLILEEQVAPGSKALRHIVNVLLHTLTACGVLLLLRRIGGGPGLSIFLALLFATHPALVPAVAWIPGRNDLLLGLFAVATLLALVAFAQKERMGAALLVVLGVAACLFTKESGIGIVVVAPAYLLSCKGREIFRPSGPRLVAAGGAVLVTVLWMAMRYSTLSGFPLFLSKILANLPMSIVYVGKSLFPIGLSPIPAVTPLGLVLGTLAIALLLVFAFANRGRLLGPVGVGALWYAVFLSPALLSPPPTRGLEHRLYVPLIGLAIALVSATWPPRLTLSPTLQRAAAVTVVALFLALSALRLPVYRSPIPFWEAAVASRPNAETLRQLTVLYIEVDRWADADRSVRRGLAYDPTQPDLRALLRHIESVGGE